LYVITTIKLGSIILVSLCTGLTGSGAVDFLGI